MNNNIKPIARKSDIVVQEYGDQILIFDLKTNKAFDLNETSTLIWQLSTGEKNISEIVDSVSKKLNSPVNEEFVWLALEKLRKENLLENVNEIANLYQGLSRREIIKRGALASIVALPMISSLVAPVAANAQSSVICVNPSGSPNGSVCTSAGGCCTNCCNGNNSPRICVSNGSTGACQQCIANCECPTGYTCPSILNRPRICRPTGVTVPPLPSPDVCM